MKRTSLLVVVLLVVLGACDKHEPATVDAPELRWVALPQEGGGFGVPADWHSTSGSGMHFAMLAAASNPALVDDLVTSYNDNGISIRDVSLWELEPDDAFVDMTVGILLMAEPPEELLPRSISAEDFHATDEHHGVPLQEIVGWRSRNENVTVRYWIGPDADEETRAELVAMLEGIRLP